MRRTALKAKLSKTSKESQKPSQMDEHSSEFDLKRYQYRDVSCYSDDAFLGKSQAPGMRVILAKKRSTDLMSAESMAQSPAKKGMLQLLKAKKLNEGPPVDLKAKVEKTRTQLEINAPTKTGVYEKVSPLPPFKDDKPFEKSSPFPPFKTDKGTPGSQAAVKGVEKKTPFAQLKDNKSKQDALSPEGTEEKPKITAAKRWKILRAATRMRGLHSEVQKRNRYITVAQIKKQVKERQKMPKLPKIKPVDMREKRFTIIIKPDRKIEKMVNDSLSGISIRTTGSVHEIHSEPFTSDDKKRESFIVPDHQSPNISAVTIPAGPSRTKKTTKSVTVIVDPSTLPRSQRGESRPRGGLSARNIFDDGKYMCIADHLHRERRRGGFDSIAAKENRDWDPPIRLSEALAAILLNLNEKEVVLVISPIQGGTLQNTSYLQVTVIERKRVRVLGSFLIPADHALSTEEEETLGRFACLCITKDFRTFQEDISPVLKYLSTSILPPAPKSINSVRPTGSQRWADPDKVFNTARRDKMTIYIRPDFLNSQVSMFICDFFTIQGSFMFSHNFTLDEIIMQWNKSPEHTNQFKVATDIVDVMFPQPCLRKTFLRILERAMKLFRIVKAYDYFCYFLFEMYKKVF